MAVSARRTSFEENLERGKVTNHPRTTEETDMADGAWISWELAMLNLLPNWAGSNAWHATKRIYWPQLVEKVNTAFICRALSKETEKAMAPHSSTLAWKIPGTGEPSRLQSMGSLRVGHDWVTSPWSFTFIHWRRKWQPTPVFLPGESQGRGSLVGCRLWGCTELDTTEVTWQQQGLPTCYFFHQSLDIFADSALHLIKCPQGRFSWLLYL